MKDKRLVLIVGINKILELSKATAVRTDKQMIHLDQLEDGTWRLIYNSNLIPDFSLVESLRIVRGEIRREENDNICLLEK